jgi:hypothetical protein
MRYVLVSLILLSACSEGKQANPWLPDGVYAGAGRDRLCIKEEGAGFIVYGKGDMNCSAAGSIVAKDGRFSLVPRGEDECKIPMLIGNGRVTLGDGGAACNYYCGPGASFAGRSFTGNASATPAIDFAGDPLC